MLMLVAVLLSQTTVVQQGRARDGGVRWPVDVTGTVACSNCSASGGGDGGTVIVNTPNVTTVGVPWDGGIAVTSLPAITGTVTAIQGTGSNLHVAVDSAPTTAVTGPLTDIQLRASAVPVSGPLTDTQLRASVVPTQDTPRQSASANNAGTCTSVAATTTVLASNASRRVFGLKAHEGNSDRVYCKLGATATTANMPFAAGSSFWMDTGAVYTGVVDCIAGSGTQTVCVFEVN